MKSKLFAVLCSLLISSVYAQEKVSGVWGFAVGSTQGSYFRAILEQANKEQNKYFFIFENKPGAGGAISSQYVYNHNGTAILAHSAAFFARPFLYKETPYNFDQFKPLMVMGFSPAALVTKNKTLDQLLNQSKITIATSGTGSTTHIMAAKFFQNWPNKNIEMVHYSSSNEAYKDVLGGHVDATFEFMGDVKAKGGTTPLGLTGNASVENLPLLKTIVPDMQHISGVFAIYVPKNMPNDKFLELQQILLKAEKHESVQRLYKIDYTAKEDYMQVPNDLTLWYNTTIKNFERFTKGINVK